MRSRLNLRRVARFACATLAMSLAAGVGAQAVITTPGGLEAVPPAPRGRLFGAIAYQRETGAVGLSYDYPTAREAELNALSRCGDRRCIVVLSLSGACGALASGR